MTNELKMHETMWAEMKPFCYGGDNFDELVPGWFVYAEGDKEGEEGLPLIELSAKTFPPGTKIVVSVPICPKCDQDAEICPDSDCDFDWDAWALDMYS